MTAKYANDAKKEGIHEGPGLVGYAWLGFQSFASCRHR